MSDSSAEGKLPQTIRHKVMDLFRNDGKPKPTTVYVALEHWTHSSTSIIGIFQSLESAMRAVENNMLLISTVEKVTWKKDQDKLAWYDDEIRTLYIRKETLRP